MLTSLTTVLGALPLKLIFVALDMAGMHARLTMPLACLAS